VNFDDFNRARRSALRPLQERIVIGRVNSSKAVKGFSIFFRLLLILTARWRLVIQFCKSFYRFVCGQVYYGISLASDQLGGNKYRDFVLTSLVEIPANVILIFFTNRYCYFLYA